VAGALVGQVASPIAVQSVVVLSMINSTTSRLDSSIVCVRLLGGWVVGVGIGFGKTFRVGGDFVASVFSRRAETYFT
jgi:hypothetical protein